jgi:sortase (surface protein transpeptidase)
LLTTVAAVLGVSLPLGLGGAVLYTQLHPSPTAGWFTPTRIELPTEQPHGDPPTRLRIPTLGVTTSLEVLTLLETGVLASPVNYGRAGWYAGGALPGDVGPAVIAGHVDSNDGVGVFYRLYELKPGSRIEVERDGTWVPFVTVATETYAKADFPTARVYGPTPGPELRLITCGGAFDRARQSYRDNVVVYAIAVST